RVAQRSAGQPPGTLGLLRRLGADGRRRRPRGLSSRARQKRPSAYTGREVGAPSRPASASWMGLGRPPKPAYAWTTPRTVAAGRGRTWDGALEVAWRLAAAGELDQRGVEGGDFWALAAEQRLAPLLYTAAATGAGMDAVVRWVYGQGGRELDRTLLELSGSA